MSAGLFDVAGANRLQIDEISSTPLSNLVENQIRDGNNYESEEANVSIIRRNYQKRLTEEAYSVLSSLKEKQLSRANDILLNNQQSAVDYWMSRKTKTRSKSQLIKDSTNICAQSLTTSQRSVTMEASKQIPAVTHDH